MLTLSIAWHEAQATDLERETYNNVEMSQHSRNTPSSAYNGATCMKTPPGDVMSSPYLGPELALFIM
jgi:hypothetical protein